MRSRAVTTPLIVAAIVAAGLAPAPIGASAVEGASAPGAGPTAAVRTAPLAAGGTPVRTATGADPLDDTASTPMLADCSSITATGREYARLHAISLCGADTTPHPSRCAPSRSAGRNAGRSRSS